MRPMPFALLALVWQSSLVVNLQAPVRPEHLRYQRVVSVHDHGTGMSCANLDVTVLAHTASPAHSDLRLFHSAPGEPETEVPYTLTESGPEPLADTAATPEHVVVHGDQVSFDLRMPARAYAEVRLGIALQNFVATATVTSQDRQGHRQSLGGMPVFDLAAQHLGRWTSLLLAEGTAPLLHITLDLRTPGGAPYGALPPGLLQEAEVPPSRLRQTRYVPTVSTTRLTREGQLSIATLRVPAHVPVERVAFSVNEPEGKNFAREVTVSARADGAPVTDTEALDAGKIESLDMPSGDPRLYPIKLREMALDATLGATLERPATVLVAVDNATEAPLPIKAVTLEMRERQLCFFADRVGTYTLRYGDPALEAPTYDEGAMHLSEAMLPAELGPEQRNPAFRARPAQDEIWKRHPEIFWLILLVSAGMMGGSALHYVQHRRV